jgi:hypothetical protein
VRGPGPLARFGWVVILAAIASGLLVEVLQGVLTADREPELADWLVEVAAILGAAFAHKLVRRLTSEPDAYDP